MVTFLRDSPLEPKAVTFDHGCDITGVVASLFEHHLWALRAPEGSQDEAVEIEERDRVLRVLTPRQRAYAAMLARGIIRLVEP